MCTHSVLPHHKVFKISTLSFNASSFHFKSKLNSSFQFIPYFWFCGLPHLEMCIFLTAIYYVHFPINTKNQIITSKTLNEYFFKILNFNFYGQLHYCGLAPQIGLYLSLMDFPGNFAIKVISIINIRALSLYQMFSL